MHYHRPISRKSSSARKWVAIIGLILAALTLSYYGMSQQLVNQVSIIVEEDALLVMPDDFTNAGSLTNAGQITVAGDWYNNALYEGAGQVNLASSQTQYVYNNGAAIGQLTVSNAGTKILGQPLVLTGSLTLEDGVVITTSDTPLRLMPEVTIDGGSSYSYINGPLIYEGQGLKFFPVGKQDHYLPLILTDIRSENAITEVEAYIAPDSIASPPPTVSWSGPVFWRINSLSGSAPSSPVNIEVPELLINRAFDELVLMEGNSFQEPFTILNAETYGEASDLRLESIGALQSRYIIIGGIIIPVNKFYLPNTLSPNASQEVNRIIKVFGNELVDQDFMFRVFNRWGVMVFESNSLEAMQTTGWDGRQQSNGEFVSQGAYPYILSAKTKSGDTIERKGMISMVR